MTRDEIISKLAPCGLDCSRCAGFKRGDIAAQSRKLRANLGNFAAMAQNMAGFFAPFKDYDSFVKILDHFAAASCEGCRRRKPATSRRFQLFVSPRMREKGESRKLKRFCPSPPLPADRL